ncbi:MAG: hypothetical protein GC190_10440 [Alphaproteobacteria bacterium]|nr:hypothetical protein [Alphaproteobacteria bacterium]
MSKRDQYSTRGAPEVGTQTRAQPAKAAELWEQYYSSRTPHPGVLPAPSESAATPIANGSSSGQPITDPDALPNDLPARLASRDPYVAGFQASNEWDGYVSAIGETTFEVELVDLRDPTGGRIKAEIPIEELDEDARKRLAIGQVLRWVVGYEITRSGQKKRASIILIRRLPRWTKNEIKSAQSEARTTAASLKWE